MNKPWIISRAFLLKGILSQSTLIWFLYLPSTGWAPAIAGELVATCWTDLRRQSVVQEREYAPVKKTPEQCDV